MYRLNDERMSLSRMTLINWLYKGAAFTSKLVDALKNQALEKDSIVNCDETWCKVKVQDSYCKKYIWCLVNKERRIAICMTHVRAKFVDAFEQSADRDAEYLLGCIGELYGLEEQYLKGQLSAEQITACRQSLKTKEIVGRIRSKLHVLTSDSHPPRGELMEKAVNYLQHFRHQLFAYLKDGRYSIDNSLAERFIRPLAGERKKSLLNYLKTLFREIVKGRSDYENLLPMTIGISTNNL